MALEEFMSCHATLPDDAQLSSYRSGTEVKLLRYSEALRAFREVAKKSGREPRGFELHFHPGGWGGGSSERVIERAGRWKSDAYKPYTVKNVEDSRRVSRILGDKEKGVARQPGENTMWGSGKRRRCYTVVGLS